MCPNCSLPKPFFILLSSCHPLCLALTSMSHWVKRTAISCLTPRGTISLGKKSDYHLTASGRAVGVGDAVSIGGGYGGRGESGHTLLQALHLTLFLGELRSDLIELATTVRNSLSLCIVYRSPLTNGISLFLVTR
jgi:hypothetical protein